MGIRHISFLKSVSILLTLQHCIIFCVDIYAISFAFHRQRMIHLRRPAQYSELLQQVKQHFGRHLSMECAISNGEVCKTALVSLHAEQGHINFFMEIIFSWY